MTETPGDSSVYSLRSALNQGFERFEGCQDDESAQDRNDNAGNTVDRNQNPQTEFFAEDID